MAITWEITITPIDIANYIASIRAIRTDDTSGDTATYEVPKAVINTGPQQVAVMDEIWAKHQVSIAQIAAVQAFVATKKVAGKANLEARE